MLSIELLSNTLPLLVLEFWKPQLNTSLAQMISDIRNLVDNAPLNIIYTVSYSRLPDLIKLSGQKSTFYL